MTTSVLSIIAIVEGIGLILLCSAFIWGYRRISTVLAAGPTTVADLRTVLAEAETIGARIAATLGQASIARPSTVAPNEPSAPATATTAAVPVTSPAAPAAAAAVVPATTGPVAAVAPTTAAAPTAAAPATAPASPPAKAVDALTAAARVTVGAGTGRVPVDPIARALRGEGMAQA